MHLPCFIHLRALDLKCVNEELGHGQKDHWPSNNGHLVDRITCEAMHIISQHSTVQCSFFIRKILISRLVCAMLSDEHSTNLTCNRHSFSIESASHRASQRACVKVDR